MTRLFAQPAENILGLQNHRFREPERIRVKRDALSIEWWPLVDQSEMIILG